MRLRSIRPSLYLWVLAAALIITATAYWPGLQGGFLFDDYPNIVDNKGLQPVDTSLPSLIAAALSSPSSEFKRPMASLSFAANYLVTGLDPYWMKLVNLVIHLLNGLLTFLLASALLRSVRTDQNPRASIVAALIASAWLLLPINLTPVLYVVQRMESLANLFVLLGLIGYVTGRRQMLGLASSHRPTYMDRPRWACISFSTGGFILCSVSITIPAAIGLLAKETAVMLPLYALLIEWALFRFRRTIVLDELCTKDTPVNRAQPAPLPSASDTAGDLVPRDKEMDWRITALFMLVLVLPMTLGLTWLLPGLLKPGTWATRDFTLGTRLLSEARIVVDYIAWTLLPTPNELSFYHDDFQISTGLLAPWSTLVSLMFLAALIALALWLRPRRPLASLGIVLFLGCQLLTGTIIPLELIYEHRNYFASFGLLLTIVPLLAAPDSTRVRAASIANVVNSIDGTVATDVASPYMLSETLPLALPRYIMLSGLMMCWIALTALTAYTWGNPLRLAEDLAARAPHSPRAQYELGRTYIIYSHYNPASPFTRLAYAPLENAAALPGSSILPEQALIFMNARMQLPIKDAWWDSLIKKLKAHKPTVQDESSLSALTQCANERQCNLPPNRMIEAFLAALAHPAPSARLLAIYGDYAWNMLGDRTLGEFVMTEAVHTEPNEPAYQITLVRMLLAQGQFDDARKAMHALQNLNFGGHLDGQLQLLKEQIAKHENH